MGWIPGSALLLGLLVAASLSGAGWSEAGLRAIVRWSARVGVVLLCLAFAASSLQTLFPHPLCAALLRERRSIGLSFALAHALHLAALVAIGLAFPEPFRSGLSGLTLAVGGLGYVLLFALALSSNDRAIARLGRVRWRRLHRVGCWVLLAIFAQNYLVLAFQRALYLPFAAAILATVGLRIARWRRVRRA